MDDKLEKYEEKFWEYYKNLKYKEALDYLLRIKYIKEQMCKDNTHYSNLAKIYNILCRVYQFLGDLNNALKYILKAKNITEEVYRNDFNNPFLGTIYNNLGQVYRGKGNLNKALEYSLKVKTIREEIYKNG